MLSKETKIVLLVLTILFFSTTTIAFPYQKHSSSTLPLEPITLYAKDTKNGGSVTISGGTITRSESNATLGNWMWLFLQHNKWNSKTKKWEKKVFTKTESRGTYDFKKKMWKKNVEKEV